jgi:hypothetical protein
VNLTLKNIVLLGIIGFVAIKLLRKDKPSISSSEPNVSTQQSGASEGNTTDPEELKNIQKYGSIHPIDRSMTEAQAAVSSFAFPSHQNSFITCRKKLSHNIYLANMTKDGRSSRQLAIDNCIENDIISSLRDQKPSIV